MTRSGLMQSSSWVAKSSHAPDAPLVPDGGYACGVGFGIVWQRGPLGRGDDRKAPNGAFVEDVLAAVIDRIQFYQAGRFACEENALALEHLETAAKYLDNRTKAREARGVEGTHEQ